MLNNVKIVKVSDENSWEEFKPHKRPRKTKKIISFIETVKNDVARIFKENRLFIGMM